MTRPFLQSQLEGMIQRSFGSAEVKGRVGAAIRAALDSAEGKQRIQQATGVTLGRIVATRFEGDALLIDYQ